VRALLARGAFHAGDVAAVTAMLRLYALAFAFSMTAICAERALLARGENGRFLRLTVARVATRLIAVACLVAPLSQFAAPIGFSLAEALYVALLVGALTRTRSQEEAR
jgi:peptidoglycan biosynthesis protein MviN/MurJ (putative lipid II flippase)